MTRATLLLTVVLTLFFPPLLRADPAPEITLIGNTQTNNYLGKKDPGVFVYVLDGPPLIKATFNKILADWPDKSLDADTAEKIQDAFTKDLKFNLEGPGLDKLAKEVEYGSKILSLTGTIEEKNGEKWLKLTKYAPASFKYPAKMLAEDKPFLPEDKPPLDLKINDKLSLKCVYIPAGSFFMGAPYYQFIRWQEDPPHRVTLTTSFYISEIPITQEIYQAVMHTNPSADKDPQFPMMGLYAGEIDRFCKALSAQTGRTIRLPTDAEWEYAARCGTSNPTFKEKHAAQNNPGGDAYSGKPGRVKAKSPNAWGLYDLAANSWEIVADAPINDRDPMTDPTHSPASDKSDHIGKGGQNYPISEMEFLHPADGKMIRFRVMVETTP